MGDLAMKSVYLAGPISSHPMIETHRALHIGMKLQEELGLLVFLPQLTVFHEIVVGGREYEQWLAWDFAWISKLDGLVRIQGRSGGADREIAYAHEIHKPVFWLNEHDEPRMDLILWAKGENSLSEVSSPALEGWILGSSDPDSGTLFGSPRSTPSPAGS